MKSHRPKPRVAILLSGTGSNMDAILNACKQGALWAEIVLIASDNPDSPGLARAAKAGFRIVAAPYKKGIPRGENEQPLIDAIRESQADWIVLAGFMRVLTSHFVSSFPGRIVNIHPSLLPAFPGAHAIVDALQAGAEVTGVTIHIVDELVDHGPIIAQEEVFIQQDDTEDSLAARIHAVEHRLYPATLQELFHEDT